MDNGDGGECAKEKDSKKDTNKMGFVSCTSYVIGNIIGSGIFITPSDVVTHVDSVGLSLLVWIGCGIISLLGSIVYIELGTSILEPGCDFAYVCYVKWFSAAFAFMWVGVLLTYPASVAVQAQTFGKYVVEGISPILALESPYDEIAEKSLGLALLAFIIWLNFHSLGEFAAKFQIVATIAKLGSMALIIISGFYCFFAKGMTENFKQPMKGSNYDIDAISMAFYSGLWSYAGWDILNYGTTEIHKPSRNMPLSLLTGISAVALIYTLINGAYFVVLSVDEVKSTSAIAATFSQRVFGNFSYAIPFMVAVLICGTLNSNIFCASRYMYAAAREGHLPPFLSCINEATGSPRAALFSQAILVVIMNFVNVSTLIEYVSFVMFFQRILTMLALLWIRYKNIPVHPGAIRVPLVLSVLFLLLNALLILVPVVRNFKVTLIGVVILASGLIIYFVFVKPKLLPQTIQDINDFLTNWTMKIFDCKTDVKAPEEKPIKKEEPDVQEPLNEEQVELSAKHDNLT